MEPISHFIGCVNELWKLLPVSLKYQDSGLHGKDFFCLCEVKFIPWVNFKVLKLPCILLSLTKSILPCEYLVPNQRYYSYLLFTASYLWERKKNSKQTKLTKTSQKRKHTLFFSGKCCLGFPKLKGSYFQCIKGHLNKDSLFL